MAEQKNWNLYQGTSHKQPFAIGRGPANERQPLDLTGYDIRMQLRRTYGAKTTEINCTLQNEKLQITNAAEGMFDLVLEPADTNNIRFAGDDESLDCVYDLELISPTGSVMQPIRGTFNIIRNVTR